MPNGIDKNWYRMCAAIDGFRARYGRWPTSIRLPEGAIDNLFQDETLDKLERKIVLIYDGSPYIAEDDAGNSHRYGQGEEFAESDIPARAWLDVAPDSDAVKAYYGRE